MTPLPPPLGDGTLRLWRLDRARHAPGWDSGQGSFLVGGRWNSRGRRAVYCALDPSTAILEVAVHKTFPALDADPHVLTSARIDDLGAVHVLGPDALPDPGWLRPGVPGAAQQRFGDALLDRHALVLVPSVVSTHSWNVVFDPVRGRPLLAQVLQERFVLDPRLHAGTG